MQSYKNMNDISYTSKSIDEIENAVNKIIEDMDYIKEHTNIFNRRIMNKKNTKNIMMLDILLAYIEERLNHNENGEGQA